jgi:hypothetical protein
MSYELIKSYYELGLFTKSDLDIFASIGWINVEQKDSIINK